MLQKVQAFNAENGNLPLKAAGAFIGAAIGAVLVAVALSLVEADAEDFVYEDIVAEETE